MEQLTATDCSRLASLHLESLPDSLISELGLRFAASFYRYLSSSPVDKVFVVRNGRGEVSGGCLLSLRRTTLHRRLILHTSLLLYALPWIVRKFLKPKAAHNSGTKISSFPDSIPADLPELLLIFTEPQARSRGVGTNLLHQCESFLIDHQISEYAVRTLDDPANRALNFYLKNAFTPCGQSSDHGRVFRVFRKRIGPAPQASPAQF